MFCPRCGEENPDGVRYCSSCGSALPKVGDTGPAAGSGFRARMAFRLRRLVGRTRRERIVSGATVGLLVVAVIAFLALDTPDETETDPAYTTLDTACVAAKADIVVASNALGGESGPENYALRVVIAMMDLRDAAEASGLDGVDELRTAAFDAAVAAGRFGRLARQDAPDAEVAEALQQSSDALNALAGPTEDLGLETCTNTSIERTE